ncbi:MAG: hypothetical protein QOE75_1482 [Solirubrobacterales bacterium]|jgi:hypothetical protein|nr:hypothetical protein [Solirubrobacterales bacterium]
MLLALAILAFLPRVEDPWPDEIDLSFPFAVAGIFGTAAQFLVGSTTSEQRERAIQRWGKRGLYAGAVFYLASLLAQVGS